MSQLKKTGALVDLFVLVVQCVYHTAVQGRKCWASLNKLTKEYSVDLLQWEFSFRDDLHI